MKKYFNKTNKYLRLVKLKAASHLVQTGLSLSGTHIGLCLPGRIIGLGEAGVSDSMT